MVVVVVVGTTMQGDSVQEVKVVSDKEVTVTGTAAENC